MQIDHSLQRKPQYRRSMTDNAMSRLPPEIISHIFLVGADMESASAIPSPKQLISPWALALSHVNRLFREIACCHTPRLWRDIHCEILGKQIPYSWEVTFQIISTLLSRSGQAPLHLSFIGYTDVNKWMCDGGKLGPVVQHQVRKFMELLVPHCHRWVSLELRVSDKKTIDLAIAALETLYVPILETLDIDGVWSKELCATTASIFAGGAPSLTNYSIAFVFIDVRTLSSIRTYNATGAVSPNSTTGISVLIEQLAFMPFLEDLTVSHVPEFFEDSDTDDYGSERNSDAPSPGNRQIITLGNVRRVSISGDSPCVAFYLSGAAFPRLIDLSLSICDSTPEVVSRALLGSHHPLNQLQSFSIQHESAKPERDNMLPVALSQMRALTTLRLTIRVDPPYEVNFPMLPEIDDDFPHLQSLTVKAETYERRRDATFGHWNQYWKQ